MILKPSPDDVLDLYLGSLAGARHLDPTMHDIRFVEDDWESPTLGAWGLGWEVWCDGMEVTQFTYFQQVGGIDCRPVSAEITYGLERLAMYVQGVDNGFDLAYNTMNRQSPDFMRWGDVYHQNEVEQSGYNFEHATTEALFQHFKDAEAEVPKTAVAQGRPHAAHPEWRHVLPAYEQMHPGEPHLQPARRARRHQRHRTPSLYRPRPRAREGMRASLGRKPARHDPRRRPERNGALMPQLLLELFSEEIPARMQAARRARSRASDGRRACPTAASPTKAHAASRRRAAYRSSSKACPPNKPTCAKNAKARKVDAPDQAIQGFLRSTGLTREQLKVQKDPKGDFYLAVTERKGRPTSAVLAELIPEIVKTFPWPKSQRWGAGDLTWVRPLHSILCTFDGEVVPFEVGR